MPNRGQDKPLAERLKAFFRGCKQSGFPDPRAHELKLHPELVEELSAAQPVQTRLRQASQYLEMRQKICFLSRND